MNTYVDQDQIPRLKLTLDHILFRIKSNVEKREIQLKWWQNFYKEKFKLEVNLAELKEIGKVDYAYTIIVMPEAVSPQRIFDLFRSEPGRFETDIYDPDEYLAKSKIKSESYISNYRKPTALEIIILDLFRLYRDENILSSIERESADGKVLINIKSSNYNDYSFQPKDPNRITPSDKCDLWAIQLFTTYSVISKKKSRKKSLKSL